MTDAYIIRWRIADAVAAAEYRMCLALGYTSMQALRRHMAVYGETMEMLS